MGNSLKTIFSRLTTNDSAISALRDIGISTTDLAGNVKSASTIIDEVAKKWNTLTDAQRQATSVGIAGVYQLSRWNALMLNYSTSISATTTSIQSQGSALAEQEKFADSLQARINRLDTAWSEFSLKMSEAIITDSLVSVVEVLDNLLETIGNLIDVTGAMAPVGATLGAVLFAISARVRTMGQAIVFGTTSLSSMQLSMLGLTAGASRASVALTALTMAGRGLAGLLAISAVFAVVGAGLGLLIKSYSDHVQAQEEFEERLKKNSDALTVNKDRTEELVSKYNDLTDAKERYGDSWSSENEEKYLQVQQQLGDLFPSLVDHIDATGQKHLKTRDAINEEIKSTEKLIEAQKDLTIASSKNTFKDLVGDLDSGKISSFFGDSIGEFLNGGSIGQQLKDAKELLNTIKDTASDEAIAELEYKIVTLEQQIADKTSEIVGHIITVTNAFNDIEINDGLQKEIEDFLYSLDFSDMNESELDSFARNLSGIMEGMQKAITDGDKVSFDKHTKELNELAKETNDFEVGLEGLKLSFDGVNLSIVKNGEIIPVLTDEYEEAADSIDVFTEKLDNAKDSISFINGVLEDYAENNKISASTIMDVVEKYPQLIGYINDEAKLIEELTKIRDVDAENARKTIAKKLEENEDFYNQNLSGLEQYFNEHFKFYDGDLKQFKTLAQAKADVETKLIEELAKKWGDYYDTATHWYNETTKQFQVDNWAVGSAGEDAANAANKELEDARKAFDEFTLDKVDLELESIGTSTEDLSKKEKELKESTDALKESTDAYKLSLEKLNLELERMQAIQAKFPTYSKTYQDALKQEIELQKEKLALMESQEKSLESIDITSTKSSNGTSNTKLTGNNVESQIWNFFKSKGLSETATAGIMGNLRQESGLDTKKVNTSSGATGIAQWMGGRLNNLKKYASSIGKSWDDLSAQLEFLWHELNGGEATTKSILNKNGGISAFNNMSVKNASELFEKAFERSGGSAQSKRNAYAEEFYKKLSNGAKEVEKFTNSITTTTKKVHGFSGTVTSNFGERADNHRGIDFDGETGDRIDSIVKGKVIKSGKATSIGEHWSYGNMVIVQDDKGAEHIYAHLEKVIAKVGDIVDVGTQIGTMGSTGNSSGSHLHYEVNVNGKPVDPTSYVNSVKDGFAEVSTSADDVESELLSVQSSIVQQRDLISDLEWKLIEAYHSVYERRKKIVDDELSFEEEKLKNLDVTSEKYAKTIEKITNDLKRKQNINNEDIAFMEEQIRLGGLNQVQIDQYKDSIKQLRIENLQYEQEIQSQFQRKLASYDEKRESPQDTIELIKSQLSMLDDDTLEYADSLNKIILSLQEIQAINEQELIDLENEIKSGKYTGEKLEELQDQYDSLKKSVADTNAEIRNTFYQQSEYVFRVNDKQIKETQDKIDFLEYQIGLLGDTNKDISIKVDIYADVQTNLNESVSQIDKAINAVLDERKKAIEKGFSTQLYDDKIDSYIQQRRNQLSQLQSVYNQIQSYVDDAFGKIANAESNAYSEASKDIDRALKNSEKRLQEYTDLIDKLNREMDLLQESDYTEKIFATEDLISQTRNLANSIVNEYERVASIPVYNEEQKEQVESQLRNLKSQLADANSQIITYYKNLEKAHYDKLIRGAEKSYNAIQRLNNQLNHNLQLLDGGLMSGMQLDFSIESISGNKLDLSSLISDPLAERSAFLQIQNIRSSSYASQIAEAESFYAEMQAKAEKFHKVMIEQIEAFEKMIEKITKEQDKQAKLAKEKSDKDKLDSTKTFAKEEKEQLEKHYKNLATTISTLLNKIGADHNTVWGNMLNNLLTILSQMESAVKGTDLDLSIDSDSTNVTTPKTSTSTSSTNKVKELAKKIVNSVIPKKYTGDDNFDGGLSIVGDKYGRELLLFPDGTVGLSDDKDQLVNLPKGTKIIPNSETEKILSGQNINMLGKVPMFADGTGDYPTNTIKMMDYLGNVVDVAFEKITEKFEEGFRFLVDGFASDTIRLSYESMITQQEQWQRGIRYVWGNQGEGYYDNFGQFIGKELTRLIVKEVGNSEAKDLLLNGAKIVESKKESDNYLNPYVPNPYVPKDNYLKQFKEEYETKKNMANEIFERAKVRDAYGNWAIPTYYDSRDYNALKDGVKDSALNALRLGDNSLVKRAKSDFNLFEGIDISILEKYFKNVIGTNDEILSRLQSDKQNADSALSNAFELINQYSKTNDSEIKNQLSKEIKEKLITAKYFFGNRLVDEYGNLIPDPTDIDSIIKNIDNSYQKEIKREQDRVFREKILQLTKPTNSDDVLLLNNGNPYKWTNKESAKKLVSQSKGKYTIAKDVKASDYNEHLGKVAIYDPDGTFIGYMTAKDAQAYIDAGYTYRDNYTGVDFSGGYSGGSNNYDNDVAVTYSDDFMKKWEVDNKTLVSAKHQRQRTPLENEIKSLQAQLDLLENSNSQDTAEIKRLTDLILNKTNELSDIDTQYIYEASIDLAKQREKIAKDEIAKLENALKTEELTEEMIKTYQDRIASQKQILNDSQLEQKELYKNWFDNEQNKRESLLTPFLDRIDDLEHELDMLDDDDHSNRLRVTQEILEQQKKYVQSLENQEKELEKLQKTQDVGSYEWNLTNEAIKNVNETLKDAKSSLKNTKRTVEYITNDITDIIKKGLEKQRDIEVAELKKKLDKLEKVYQSKLDAIGDRESERTFTNDRQDIQTEISDLEKQLNILSLDDSQEAIAKRLDLQKQLKEKREELAELEYQRGVELEKKAIEDSHERQKEAIDKEIEDVNWKYNEMLADERYFAKLREDILNGNLATANEKLKGFLDIFKVYNETTTRELGESFQELLNLIDDLNTAYTNLSSIRTIDDINKKDADLKKTEPKKYNSDGFYFSIYEGQEISVGKNNIDLIKYLTESGYNLYEYGTTTPISRDVIKKKYGFANGGLTSSTGLHWLDGTLGKPEIVLNPDDTKNLLDIVKMTRNLIPQLPKIQLPSLPNLAMQGAGDTNYHLTLHIDNLNGTQKDANNLASTIMQSLKKMGRS